MAGLSGQWDAIAFEASAVPGFLILFFAIAWLQFPVGRLSTPCEVTSSPVRPDVATIFDLWVHILGSVLNLAGLSLLTTIVERQKQFSEKRRLSVALMQGLLQRHAGHRSISA